MSIVLMYHALYSDAKDLERIAIEDQPYAVRVDEFCKHLSVLNDYTTGLLNSEKAENPQVLVTFDDGHVSNYDRAMPHLVEAGVKAYFFVTSDFVGKREHFCNAGQLREMADAGMVIGAHGKTHSFFADLDDQQAIEEFTSSRQLLQEAVGRQVDTMSFPGGRYSKENLEQARTCGYREIYGSGFGPVQMQPEGNYALPINRIPLKQTTQLDNFRQIVAGNRKYYARETVKTSCKVMLKRLLGNNRYHALYKFAAERH